MQCVLLHGSYSSKESVKYGVPQSSVLGLILFSLFINDLPLHVKNISVDCDMLADDTHGGRKSKHQEFQWTPQQWRERERETGF